MEKNRASSRRIGVEIFRIYGIMYTKGKIISQ